jgi:two-component system chemotaxis response regulator CheB
MTVAVLIVDDSGFFCRRLSEMINACDGLKVIGTASNGKEAVELVKKLKPDVVTMDYEMPVMNGITAVKHIMDECPTPVLMFSSLTYEGARVTLDSLEAGAVDFLPKNFEDISNNSSILRATLESRLKTIAKAKSSTPAVLNRAKSDAARPSKPEALRNNFSRTGTRKPYSLIVIGASTGGPVALQKVLSVLPADFSIPIVIVQHMPATFTAAFAERLNTICKIKILEGKDGDMLRPGTALLAPGGKQLMVTVNNRIKVLPGDERLNYKPSVDVTFGSAANAYNDKVLAIVLTGMGSDGCEGARLLKQKGSSVWAQDESTSVIYGMPMMVAKANLADEILPLTQVGERLKEVV